jgi:hypothetical protein
MTRVPQVPVLSGSHAQSHEVGKAVNSTKSQYQAEIEPKAAFEVEWSTFIKECGEKINSLVQDGVLASNLAYLNDFSTDFVIAQPSATRISANGPHTSFNCRAESSNTSPLTNGECGWHRSGPELSSLNRVASFSPNAEDFATGALGELYVSLILFIVSRKLNSFSRCFACCRRYCQPLQLTTGRAHFDTMHPEPNLKRTGKNQQQTSCIRTKLGC